MAKIDQNYFDIGMLDRLAEGDSALHRLDPRAKLITTLIFITIVVSFDKYAISALIPFVFYPVVLCMIGRLPVGYILRKILLVAPFAVMIGIFNPLLDRGIHLQIGMLEISGGWISFLSILIRFTLTVGSALILIAVTGFNAVCLALEKLGTPRVFVVQLLFLYRYLFVLMDEAMRLVKARALRTFGRRQHGIRTFGPLVGHLLLRTLDRAQRIHLAMCSRGFDGRLRIIRPLIIGRREIMFILGWSLFFGLMRFYNFPRWIGMLMTEAF